MTYFSQKVLIFIAISIDCSILYTLSDINSLIEVLEKETNAEIAKEASHSDITKNLLILMNSQS